MPTIAYPNVPAAPGIPALPRSPMFPPAGQAALGAVQGVLWRALQLGTRWGVYDKSGVAIFDPSSSGVVGAVAGGLGIGPTLSTSSFEFSAESRVSDFPVEQGSFATYNKVEQPFVSKVTLSFQGSEAQRTRFLATLETARTTTQILDVVTPEVRYVDVTLENYGYRRSNGQGATLLKVELSLKKIRQVAAAFAQSSKSQVDKPRDVGASPTADGGKVQAATPSASTLKTVAAKLGF